MSDNVLLQDVDEATATAYYSGVNAGCCATTPRA